MTREETLAERILEYLKAHKRLTAMEAVDIFHTTRLGARIFDLRHEGHDIVTIMEKEVDPVTKEEYKYGVYVYRGSRADVPESKE